MLKTILLLLQFSSFSQAQQVGEEIIAEAEQAAKSAESSGLAFFNQIPETNESPSRDSKGHEKQLKVAKQPTVEPKQACYSKIKNLTESKKAEPQGELLIFVSTSLPKQVLQALSTDASRLGGRLIFRGLINNSFKETQLYFREAQINAEIDPTPFESYQVTAVPTFILTDAQGKRFDRIQGNISSDEALSKFKEKGELRRLASDLLRRLRSNF
ncbi:MAG: type-F conjugative transfer system pilin assembly protein TrbC [Candidatus Paracaedibacteraceae bacterium]|nr:type-F conjugative transfer system pilin assembly protein TrbC [Candidatus Paracaedibacteraceae bacterium]